MVPTTCLHLLVLVFLWSVQLVWSIPPIEGMFGRSSSIGMVVGPTPVEAVAISHFADSTPRQTRHLRTQEIGSTGNLTMLPNDVMPPLYYLKKDRLWQWVNETTVLPVNVMNVTTSALVYNHPPFQLVVGKKVEGIQGGTWRYSGSMLYYDFPGRSETQGLFYKCNPSTGFEGVFMYCQQGAPPAGGCDPFTLHSFSRERPSL